MKEYYYQIKGRKGLGDDTMFNWTFPPIFSGKVSAKDKTEAKEIICKDYEKVFPLRVLRKDIDSNEFLLDIQEIKEDSHIARLFEPQICEQCGTTFYVIDKYNDFNTKNKGFTFCSDSCKNDNSKLYQFTNLDNDGLIGGSIPVIYKITNKSTGMVYIGKTTQVFTLRWYQHFFHLGKNKFHEAIKNSNLSEWMFEIQEVIQYPQYITEGLKNKISDGGMNKYQLKEEMDKFIVERERYWINYFDSINHGYNSI